jgi:hypothetical protein
MINDRPLDGFRRGAYRGRNTLIPRGRTLYLALVNNIRSDNFTHMPFSLCTIHSTVTEKGAYDDLRGTGGKHDTQPKTMKTSIAKAATGAIWLLSPFQGQTSSFTSSIVVQAGREILSGDEASGQDGHFDCYDADGVCADSDRDATSYGYEPSITPDPNLHPMTLPDGSQFYAYKTPPVSTFYPDGTYPDNTKPRTPRLRGICGRFTNMSPERKVLVWIPEHAPDNPAVIAGVDSFDTGGTATFFGHMFCFVDPSDLKTCESEVFTVEPNVARYVYNPYDYVDEDNPYGSPDDLSPNQRALYDILVKDMDFAARYKTFTGREYLSRFPRQMPSHYMYPADYIGQTHTVETKETHFVSLPPEDNLNHVSLRKLESNEVRFRQGCLE